MNTENLTYTDTMAHSILIIDDEKQMCISLSKLLEAHGFTTDYSISADRALEKVRKNRYDLIITDLKIPGTSGLELIQTIKSMRLPVPIIMISGYASVENVVEAMKFGAHNFYSKPLDISRLVKEIKQFLAVHSESGKHRNRIITDNLRMQDLLLVAKTAAPTDAPVIISGESGTGKELFAAYIHTMSHRASAPYITMNCASIPETLLESELFGHTRGAFTDAREDRKGKFEMAEKGTIFFDEIGEMSLQTQAKLLRVLQEKEYERLGSNEVRKMDVRFIAATNKDLQEMIRKGQFREDLYYRLSVITIDIPSLRERKEDILPLARHFLNEFNCIYNKQINAIGKKMSSVFLRHDWPGNVRELKNCLERAVIFCEEQEIQPRHLPQQYRALIDDDQGEGLKQLYDKITREVILDALEQTNGSKQKAAEILGINRRTLYNKMKMLDLA